MQAQYRKVTYTGTGLQSAILIDNCRGESSKVQISGGSSDVWTLKAQICSDAQITQIQNYSNITGGDICTIPGKCYAIYLYITTNTSGSIIVEVIKE